MAITSDETGIFIHVRTKALVPGSKLKLATNEGGFFSSRIDIDSTSGRFDEIEILTFAPVSAMSGADSVIAELNRIAV